MAFRCVQCVKGRHTKLLIVLLQKITNPSDDALAGERLSTLASKCDINQKMVFVLPYNDNLTGKFLFFLCVKSGDRSKIVDF